MVFVRVVASFRFHELALLVQFRKGAILSTAARGNSRQNLHFLLILSKFEFIRQKGLFLLPAESIFRFILVHFFLVEGLEHFDLIFMDFLDSAEA